MPTRTHTQRELLHLHEIQDQVRGPAPRNQDRHARNPIPFRPPAADRERLGEYAARNGIAVNVVLTEALREYLGKHDADYECSPVQ